MPKSWESGTPGTGDHNLRACPFLSGLQTQESPSLENPPRASSNCAKELRELGGERKEEFPPVSGRESDREMNVLENALSFPTDPGASPSSATQPLCDLGQVPSL